MTTKEKLLSFMLQSSMTLYEVAETFDHISHLLFSIRESMREDEDRDYRDIHASSIPFYRRLVREDIEKYGICITLEEIEKEVE